MERPASDEVAVTPSGRLASLPLPTPLRRMFASDFAQKVAETFGTRVFLILINAVNTILIARLLGPEGRGQYAVAIAIAAIGAQVLSFGLQSANTYFVARDRSLLGALTSNSLALGVIASVLGALGFGVFALLPGASPISLGLTALAIATVPPMLLTLNLRYLLLGIGEVRSFNVVDLLASSSGVAITLVLAVSGAATPASLLAVAIAVGAIGALIAARALRPFIGTLPRPSAALLRRCGAYGFRVFLATGFGLLVLKSDLLVVQFERGSEASGLYSVSSSVADLLWILPAVVGAILFPRLTAMSDLPARWRLTERVARYTLLAMIPILALTALLAPVVIRVAFGADFEDAAPSLRILCAAVLFYGITSVFSQFLAARGLPWIVPAIWGSGFALNLALNLLLVPSIGIEGAALASLISYAAVFAAILATSVRYARRDAGAPA